MTESTSTLLHKGPCADCGSSDACAVYDDGHSYCFSCGKHGGHNQKAEPPRTERSAKDKSLLTDGEVSALPKRRISQDTCEHFNYQCGMLSGKPVQIANYYGPNGGPIVAQKIRFPPTADGKKDFTILGNMKEAGLYGQHLWRDGGKMVVVTEGEIDTLSVSQMQGNKWPVVSVQNGAQAAKKSLSAQLQWLLKFDTIVLMFDDDEPGRKAVEECAPLFPVGRCKVATVAGFKDANEALQAGEGGKIIDAIWGAKEYRPDGILTFSDIAADMRAPTVVGLPWWDERLTQKTYGRRFGEWYALGAGTGVGKTDWLMQQTEFDMRVLGLKVGLFYLEQPPKRTGLLLANKMKGKRFHVPDGSWTQAELDEAVSELERENRALIYNSAGASFGATAWDTIKDRARFMAHHEGVKSFYLDHLTALAAAEDDERKALEKITAELSGLAQELDVMFHVVSHLATPDGTPHEEGGRVMIRHFKGSRAIGFWAHFMFGLERNQQSSDPAVRGVTTFRVLKDRNTGDATGEVLYLGYDRDAGRLIERNDPPPQHDSASKHGFRDESTQQDF